MVFPHAPGTTWRRAVKRVDRRAAFLNAIERGIADGSIVDPLDCIGNLRTLLIARANLREAVRLSNRIYMSCVAHPVAA